MLVFSMVTRIYTDNFRFTELKKHNKIGTLYLKKTLVFSIIFLLEEGAI